MMQDRFRKGLRWLWHPLPFISEATMMRVLWLMPIIAFLLFLGLIASLGGN